MACILIVGSLNMDLVAQMPSIPRPGETVIGGRFSTFPGGKGSNQAVAAARTGSHVAMVGKVGDDSFGNQMLQVCKDEGIDTRFIGIDPHDATGVALIIVDSQGQNSIAVASGANLALTADEVHQAMEQLSGIDILVMPLEIPIETVKTAAKIASSRGVRVILNPAPAQELDEDLLHRVDVIIPNENEAERLTGLTIHDEHDARKAGEMLIKLGVGSAIITLGSKGALIIEGPQHAPACRYIPAFSVPATDTTAAGDAFVGALATGLGEGLTLYDAAVFANASAAISVTRLGAQPSLPRREEVDRFLKVKSLPL
jgi:ribokinase